MEYLREYQNDDLEAVKRLHKAGLSQCGVLFDDPVLDEDLDNIPAVYNQDTGGLFLVGVIADDVIAMGAMKRVTTMTAEIKRMRVAIQFQRQGIGRMILERLIENAGMFGYSKLILDTTMEQVAARRLYEGYGFDVVGRRVVYGVETVFYEMELG